jgi:hypothetical protein
MTWFTILYVLAGHVVGFLLFWWFTLKEVAVNVQMIEKDGSANTLGAAFHMSRTKIRLREWLECTAIGVVPIGFSFTWLRLALSFAALGLLLAGFFFRTFSPMLNHAMKLAYKSRFYVSFSTTASLLDRLMVRLSRTALARKLIYGDESQRATSLFQDVLNLGLLITLLGYVGLMVYLFRHGNG